MACYLSKGSKGPKVYMLQDVMQQKGYYKGYKKDSYFGPILESEVIRWQRDHGLTVDGCVGCETWNSAVYPPCPWATTPTPAPSPAGSTLESCLNTTLQSGSNGDCVKILQQKLQEFGYYNGKIDGDFGPLTRGSVISFQAATGHSQDGVCGPKTWSSVPIYGANNGTVTGNGTIKSACEKLIGSFSNFTGFYNKMIGRGYKSEMNDTETLQQELSDLTDLNCVNATQVGVLLAREMGYNARFCHVYCTQSGTGHIYGQIKGKEFGDNWVNFDLAAAMSVGSKYPIGQVWCSDAKIVAYNEAWLESDDGKT